MEHEFSTKYFFRFYVVFLFPLSSSFSILLQLAEVDFSFSLRHSVPLPHSPPQWLHGVGHWRRHQLNISHLNRRSVRMCLCSKKSFHSPRHFIVIWSLDNSSLFPRTVKTESFNHFFFLFLASLPSVFFFLFSSCPDGKSAAEKTLKS